MSEELAKTLRILIPHAKELSNIVRGEFGVSSDPGYNDEDPEIVQAEEALKKWEESQKN